MDCSPVQTIPLASGSRRRDSGEPSGEGRLEPLRRLKRWFERKTARASYLLKFATVGLSGMGIDLLAFSLLRSLLSLGVARGAAIWVAMTWNFYFNRRLTFSYACRDSVWTQYFLFCGSCLLGAFLNWSVSVLLCLANSPLANRPNLAAVVGVAAGFASNYWLSRWVVFRQKREPFRSKPSAPTESTEREVK